MSDRYRASSLASATGFHGLVELKIGNAFDTLLGPRSAVSE